MSKIVPVIMCGGSGTRLWPRSRKARPKPFLPLLGNTTLFSQTLARCSDPAMFASPIVVAGAAHGEHIRESLPDDGVMIVEPEGRNTAPAIALAAARLPSDAIMLVCPSDHHIRDGAAFCETVADAAELARRDYLVAIGIRPTGPETGFGYIERGDEISPGHAIRRFVEKPDLERAKQFLDDGNFSWNGGIFVFRAGVYLDELRKFRPDMAELVTKAVAEGREEGDSFHPAAEPFCRIDGDSIDYAVMENTQSAATVLADMGWSDIGNWKALLDEQERDGDGNVVRGRGDLVDCRNVYVDSDGPRVSVIGLEDVVVVVDGNDIVITTIDGAQKVGKLPGALDQ
ncbi:mannose-1-phosphate guanylyltransferase [Aurantiacibacter poecillastricola]|uniref:mannose-1-phosphate guanylyltransferase n=1 Tax=Aurantiacibacter poecillastricola TaxID=3064385 RepID=UPI00273FDD05|nr:sugar phosphate nucleotidyltransferase [Aurantiacibacter sp. 219JJ12-13]MDP5260675.1 sugar phosphate nucleotidyltransferase [Aurantiacibacter sp. 219JJ12-13]